MAVPQRWGSPPVPFADSLDTICLFPYCGTQFCIAEIMPPPMLQAQEVRPDFLPDAQKAHPEAE
jgi:hypothetical protein